MHGILLTRVLAWAAVAFFGGLPDPGIEPWSLMSPAVQAGSLPLVPPEKPIDLDLGLNPDLALGGCVTFDQSLNFSGPQSSHL